MDAMNGTVSENTTVTLFPVPPKMRSLFDINYDLGVVYVLFISVLSIAGIAGNSAILYVMKKEPQVKGHARLLMINMAIADLFVTGIANPMCIIGAFSGKRIMQWGSWLCFSVASMCLTACICVFMNIVNITVNRWIYICFNSVYHKLYNKTTTILICVLCWVLGFAVEFPNFIGWGDHHFDEKTHQCSWNPKADRSYTVLVTAGFITVPLALILLCNMSMIKRIWDVKRNIHGYQASYRQSVIATVSQVKILMTIMIITLVCWLPYVALLMHDHGGKASMETNMFITLLAHSHSTWTPIIYLCYQTSPQRLHDNKHVSTCPCDFPEEKNRSDLPRLSGLKFPVFRSRRHHTSAPTSTEPDPARPPTRSRAAVPL